MGVKATTNVENKPKATMKNLQFVENLDKLIGIAEKAEENGDATKGKHRSSYDLVNVRSLYIERYDWFDTVFEEGGKLGLKDIKGDVVVPAKYDGFQERCHFLFARNVPRVALVRGKAGLVKADGSGEELTPFDYDASSFMIIEPYFMMKKGDKMGILGMDGHVIAPCFLDEIYHPSGRCVVFKAGGKYGILDSYCNDLYVAPQYDNIEFIDMEQPYTVTKDGVQGVINEAGTFMTDEEALDYEGYLVGEYNSEF